MRIAVASHDGNGVAPTAESARFLLVFPVTDNLIGEPELRSFGEQAATAPLARQAVARLGEGTQIIPFPAVPTQPGGEDEDEIVQEILRASADCEVLVVGSLEATHQATCRQLGIMPLLVTLGGEASQVVRFVVSGSPPNSDGGCAGCPGTQHSTTLQAPQQPPPIG